MNKYWKKRDDLYNKFLKATESKLAFEYKRILKELKVELSDLFDEILEAKADGTILVSDLYRYNRYYDLQNNINAELRKLGEKEINILTSNLTDLYIDNKLLIGKELVFEPLINVESAKRAIKTIWCSDGKIFSDRIWTNMSLLEQQLQDGIINVVVQGKSKAELVRTITDTFNVDYNKADRIARTELSYVQNKSTLDAYVEAGVKEYEWLDTKDGRCCDECHEMNGKRFPVTDTEHLPPGATHPNCRCTILAVIE